MYVPRTFAQEDRTKLFDFMEANSFALMVSHDSTGMTATHLPLLVKRDAGPHGELVGHMARANPHWQSMAGREVLVVFTGPHAYISPPWYESENMVPTWNYLAVHATGPCEIVDDPQATGQIVLDYVATYERSQPTPWTIDPNTPFFDKLIRMVVGFRIPIRTLEGKWKLGQNHNADRRASAARHLLESADFNAQEIGRLMNEKLA